MTKASTSHKSARTRATADPGQMWKYSAPKESVHRELKITTRKPLGFRRPQK